MLVTIVSFFLSISLAQNMSALEYFDRCYMILTKDLPSATDPSLVKLKSNQITSKQACLEVLDRAQLGTNNRLRNPSDQSARQVLKTFNEFHRSWFQSKRMTGGTDATDLLIDSEEPALYLSRAVFKNGLGYRSIVTGNDSLRGLRVRPNQATVNNFRAQAILSYSVTSFPTLANSPNLFVTYLPPGKQAPMGLERISVSDARIITSGELIGIDENPAFRIPEIRLDTRTAIPAEIKAPVQKNLIANENQGGGILGSQVFISYNSNLIQNVIADEDRSINRRIAARAFEDLMCHDLPSLSTADVPATEIQPNSPLAFHRSRTCMACHSQMDPAADVYRNLVLTTSSPPTQVGANEIGSSVHFHQALPTQANSNIWALKPPTGTLRYREFQANAPTVRSVANVEQLGAGFAASLDLYRCAVKRYYKMFTGIDVTLHPLLPPPANASAALKTKYELDKEHQSFVLSAANRLRTHQSVRTVISEILDRPAFKSRSFGTKETP